jgi:hypothetical protein
MIELEKIQAFLHYASTNQQPTAEDLHVLEVTSPTLASVITRL